MSQSKIEELEKNRLYMDLTPIRDTYMSLIPCMEILEQYFMLGDNVREKTFPISSDVFQMQLFKNSVRLDLNVSKFPNGSGFFVLSMHFESVYGQNEINTRSIQLNTAIPMRCEVQFCTDFYLEVPYDVEEEIHFQYNTVYDLPIVESYKIAQEIITAYQPQNAVYLNLYMDTIINNNLVPYIVEFCNKLKEEMDD